MIRTLKLSYVQKSREWLSVFFQSFSGRIWGSSYYCKTSERILVTAFDASHFRSGQQLLSSLDAFNQFNRVYVFDLGMTPNQIGSLSSQFPAILLRKYDFQGLPEFQQLRNNAGAFAWKPQIISLVADRETGFLVWCDAGNRQVAKLSSAVGTCRRLGIVAGPASGTIGDWTQVETFAISSRADNAAHARMSSAACLFFDLGQEKVRNVIQKWHAFSLLEDVIAPKGANRKNHRYDQSVLSILFEEYGFRLPLKCISGAFLPPILGFEIHRDVE